MVRRKALNFGNLKVRKGKVENYESFPIFLKSFGKFSNFPKFRIFQVPKMMYFLKNLKITKI
jgi:hypothetical protein